MASIPDYPEQWLSNTQLHRVCSVIHPLVYWRG